MTEETKQPEPIKVVAENGKAYPIRLLHMVNGQLIIGMVIDVFPDVMMILRPYEVEVAEDDEGNISAYQLVPYLDQLAEYDPQTLNPVPFMNANMIAPVVPARHMISTYMAVTRLREGFVDGVEYPIRKRHYASARTKH